MKKLLLLLITIVLVGCHSTVDEELVVQKVTLNMQKNDALKIIQIEPCDVDYDYDKYGKKEYYYFRTGQLSHDWIRITFLNDKVSEIYTR